MKVVRIAPQAVVQKPAAPERKGTVKQMAGKAKRNSVQAIKANPKKSAGCCACCCTVIIVVIVLMTILGGAAAAAAVLYSRYFFFDGDLRESSVGGAAMGQGGRKSLVPQKEEDAEVAAARRRKLMDTTTTTLAKCPRDSQVVIESETTPSSVYDGTTIFQFVDQVNCLLQLTRPGTDETIN